MKKKIMLITGIVTCVAISFFNVSHCGKSDSLNSDLSSLVKINNANAECFAPIEGLGGHCLSSIDYCVYAVIEAHWDCDPTIH